MASQLTEVKESATTANTKLADVTSDVAATKTDVAATKTELQNTVADLKRVRKANIGLVRIFAVRKT